MPPHSDNLSGHAILTEYATVSHEGGGMRAVWAEDSARAGRLTDDGVSWLRDAAPPQTNGDAHGGAAADPQPTLPTTGACAYVCAASRREKSPACSTTSMSSSCRTSCSGRSTEEKKGMAAAT